jgi:hypothetical protein
MVRPRYAARGRTICGSHRSATTLPLKGKPGLRATRSRVSHWHATLGFVVAHDCRTYRKRTFWSRFRSRCGELARLASAQEARETFSLTSNDLDLSHFK